jgi:hypothetical protein
MFNPFSAGWFLMLSGVSPWRDLPGDIALGEIGGGDAAIRRFHQRQAVDGHHAGAEFLRTSRPSRR